MNRGHVLQSSPVQQMVATGNPNRWNINNQQSSYPFLSHPFNSSSNFSSSFSSLPIQFLYDNQELHQESLSQLLLGGLVGEEVKSYMNHFHRESNNGSHGIDHVKQESSYSYNNIYGLHANNIEDQFQGNKPSWSTKSCVTISNIMLDFSSKNHGKHPPQDLSSESNSSTTSGGALKKARVQPSSTQSTLKVRKEKLGDRITALHQLVSPFGKTDTASVLFESIGYIRFLQSQVEALSLPYLESGPRNNIKQQHHRCNSLEEPKKDLRSRGLCLVPTSCMLQVGSDNGAYYWAPTASGLGGGGFR